MPSLYVTTQGARVRKSSRRLIVRTDDGIVQGVRLSNLDRLVISGNVDITTPAIVALLEHGISTTFLSRGGRLLGHLQPPGAKNVFVRLAQFQRYQDLQFRLRIGRCVVSAKIRNSRRVLQLFSRRRPDLDLSETSLRLEKSAERAMLAEGLPQLMGVEGEAAVTYFRAYGALMLGELQFTTRSRRPPKDPINAMLSFGYTLLACDVLGALAGEGLDPDVGFLHELSYGRPGLALDLVEEFRQPVVDRLVLSLANRRVFLASDFHPTPDEGLHLMDAARARFLEFYDRTMSSNFQHRGADTTYRSLVRNQARELARAVVDNVDYAPYRCG